MTTQKIAHCFEFTEEFRSKLTFSDSTKIFLDSASNQIALRKQSYDRSAGKDVYSLDANLSVTIEAINPLALVAWAGIGSTPRPSLQPTGATVGYKLNDGTDDRYWGGGSWSVAGLTDWNTEAVMAANIATFPATSKTISVVINLVTTDKYETPTLTSIDLLGQYNISYLYSLIAGSFVPALRSTVSFQVDYLIRHGGTNKIHLLDFVKSLYNINTIDAVYDDTSDPTHVTNLYSAWDSTDSVITLSSAVARGNNIFIVFTVEPEVAINWSSQDYTETSRLPAIVLESFDLAGNVVWGSQEVKNVGTNLASVRRDPTRLQLAFTVQVIAESNKSLFQMMDGMLSFAANTPVLTWLDLDKEITLTMIAEGAFSNRPNLKDRYTAGYNITLSEVFLWFKPETTKPLVQTVNLSLQMPTE